MIVHQEAHKGSNVVFSCPFCSARDTKPCRAHYSADSEWGVMPWIAGLFCCSRSRTSIPLEEKEVTCYWFVKRNKRRCLICLVRLALLYVNYVLSLMQLLLHRHRPKSGVVFQGTVQDLQPTHQLNLRGVNQVNDSVPWHTIAGAAQSLPCCLQWAKLQASQSASRTSRVAPCRCNLAITTTTIISLL